MAISSPLWQDQNDPLQESCKISPLITLTHTRSSTIKKNLPSAPSEEFIASTIVSGTIEKLVL